MSIASQLNYLMETKNLIKEAIESKGVDVGDATFREYAEKIDSISSGTSIETVSVLNYIISYGSSPRTASITRTSQTSLVIAIIYNRGTAEFSENWELVKTYDSASYSGSTTTQTMHILKYIGESDITEVPITVTDTVSTSSIHIILVEIEGIRDIIPYANAEDTTATGVVSITCNTHSGLTLNALHCIRCNTNTDISQLSIPEGTYHIIRDIPRLYAIISNDSTTSVTATFNTLTTPCGVQMVALKLIPKNTPYKLKFENYSTIVN